MKACVTISESNMKRALSIVDKFDFSEVRLDLCKFNSHQIKEIFAHKKGLIATYRADESMMSLKLEALKLSLEAGASFIDLEFDLNQKYVSELVLFARNYGAKVILSYHNYNETPSVEDLERIVKEGKDRGADYIKIATAAATNEECLRILNLYANHEQILAFGIGESAKYTRIASLFLGAPFTYVYYGTQKNQLAEGQPSHREFASIMEGYGVS